MSKTFHPRPSKDSGSNVARGMIQAGTGRAQKFGDKRLKRQKDARVMRERMDEYGYTAAELVFVLAGLFGVACFIGLICVIVHFVAKMW